MPLLILQHFNWYGKFLPLLPHHIIHSYFSHSSFTSHIIHISPIHHLHLIPICIILYQQLWITIKIYMLGCVHLSKGLTRRSKQLFALWKNHRQILDQMQKISYYLIKGSWSLSYSWVWVFVTSWIQKKNFAMKGSITYTLHTNFKYYTTKIYCQRIYLFMKSFQC